MKLDIALFDLAGDQSCSFTDLNFRPACMCNIKVLLYCAAVLWVSEAR